MRFRWSRAVPSEVKSCRVTCDRAGRWHVAFVSIPNPIPAPGNTEVVGIDRGVVVSAALSTGELLNAVGLSASERKRLRRLERKLARARRGSNRRSRVRLAIAGLRARETDRLKDWAEKTSTDIARRFDVIRVENLQVRNMTRSAKGTRENPGRNVRQKAGLNPGILRSEWGLLVRRLEKKAPGRVEKITPAFTSQHCSACGRVDPKSRESRPVNREPQLLASLAVMQVAGIPALWAWEDVKRTPSLPRPWSGRRGRQRHDRAAARPGPA